MSFSRPALRKMATSRAVTPGVLGIFLLLYVAIAFGSNEPLTALMAFTRGNPPLLALLALLPLSALARLTAETAAFVKRRRALSGKAAGEPSGLFDDELRLPQDAAFSGQQERLAALGYATRRTENFLGAWRGVSLFPARFLFLLASFCLFCGILLSLATRVSHREAVLEGEPLPGSGDLVQRITLREERGVLLERALDIEVALQDGGPRSFGLYPPSRHRGSFLYPRYLGIAPLLRLSAPGLPEDFEQYVVLSIYPPGKEDSAQIPGSPYRLLIQMAPDAESDPYLTGKITLQFRVLKGEEQVFAGSAPIGGEAAGAGYRIAFPAFRRMVVTDFVQDFGVPLIWSAGALFALALLLWLPVRLFWPRQEMLFLKTADAVAACSRAEGGRRAHAGRFHEVLDLLQPGQGEP